MYSNFEKILKQKKLSSYKVAKEAGVTQTSLSNWKNGKSVPSTTTLQKIADYLGVTVDYLMNGEEIDKKVLNEKDERDIKQAIEDFKNRLSTAGVMYDGEPLDEESQAAILAAVELAERTARIAAKEKFTPKKYKK